MIEQVNIQKAIDAQMKEQASLLAQIKEANKESRISPGDKMVLFKLALLHNQYDECNKVIKALEQELKA